MENYLQIIEAVLFASSDPVSKDKFCEIFELCKNETDEILKECVVSYNKKSLGLEIISLENSFQIVTKKEFSPYIKKALEIKRNTPLSPAAMEVIAIIAYNQPVTKSFIEQIRGIDSSSIVNTLVEKELITEAGRLDLPGRPISYKTTANFLRCFNISSLAQLPPLPDSSGQIVFDEIKSQ
jgi:segregation and condensation protein B